MPKTKTREVTLVGGPIPGDYSIYVGTAMVDCLHHETGEAVYYSEDKLGDGVMLYRGKIPQEMYAS